MKIKYGTQINKSRPTISSLDYDTDKAFFVKVLLAHASKALGRVEKVTLPLVITISEDHNSIQWYAEMEE